MQESKPVDCWPNVIAWSAMLPNEFVVTLDVLLVYCPTHADESTERIMSPLFLPTLATISCIDPWIS